MQSLSPQSIAIWTIDIEKQVFAPQKLYKILSKPEIKQAERFHFEADRQRFSIAHAGLRHILSQYLGLVPAEIEFETGKHGKPSITGSKNIQFNLSHSQDQILIAVSQDDAVGVDIEYHKTNLDFMPLAERFFSKLEVEQLRAMPPAKQLTGFFTFWSCKEAFIKATGLGLAYGLENFSVKLTDTATCTLYIKEQLSADWQLVLLPVTAGYSGAVAVNSKLAVTTEHHHFDLP